MSFPSTRTAPSYHPNARNRRQRNTSAVLANEEELRRRLHLLARYVRKLLSYRLSVLVLHSAKARAKVNILTAVSIAFPHNIPNGFRVNALTVCFHVSRQSVCYDIKKPFPFLSLPTFNLNRPLFIERLSIIAIELSASALSRIIPAYAGSTAGRSSGGFPRKRKPRRSGVSLPVDSYSLVWGCAHFAQEVIYHFYVVFVTLARLFWGFVRQLRLVCVVNAAIPFGVLPPVEITVMLLFSHQGNPSFSGTRLATFRTR
nr:MAG TPA: hypothetical protein [Caudoviricetes sp.]